jgi:hypothetical protein
MCEITWQKGGKGVKWEYKDRRTKDEMVNTKGYGRE